MSTRASISRGLLDFSTAAGRADDQAADVRLRASALAQALRASGVDAGAAVALRLTDPADTLAALLAVFEVGALAWPLEAETPAVARALLAEGRPQALVLDAGAEALGFEGPRFDPRAPVALPGTAASVGAFPAGPALLAFLERPALRARGVLLPEEALLGLAGFLAETLALDLSDTVIADVPPALGLPLACAAWARGGRVRFEAPGQAPLEGGSCLAVPLGLPAEGAGVLRPGLRHLLTAGEHEFDAQDLKQALRGQGVTWHNFYGLPGVPLVTTLAVEAVDGREAPRHVGRPLPGVEPYLLDDAGRPAVAGARARLFLGGAWQATPAFGAQADEQLDPARPGARRVDSGWRAVGRRDGRLVALGRADGSAPFRRGRLDLAGLESGLADPGSAVERVACVRVGLDGRARLCVYSVGTPPDPGRVAALLPDWVRPLGHVELAALPRTPAGAVDGERLAASNALDDLDVAFAEQALSAAAGGAVALLAEPQAEPLGRWHLDDVLPGRVQRSGPEAAGPGPEQAALTDPLVPDPPPALAEGPPLRADALPGTLAEALTSSAAAGGVGGVGLLRPGQPPRERTYAELWECAARVHAGLTARGLRPGDKVVLQLGPDEAFFDALWGCLHGGFVPVPLAIPPAYAAGSQAADTLLHVYLKLERPLLVAGAGQAAELAAFLALRGSPAPVAEIDELRRAEPCPPWDGGRGDDLALLLFTSGSTGSPKGVRLTQSNVLAHARAVHQAFGIGPHDVSLNWMPLEHVGALVMLHLRDALLGARQFHARTADVLAEPLLWVDWLSSLGVSLTWAPNFAYGLVAERAAALAERRLDLSRLRLILNGGEAVNARTVRAFLERLAPCGLAPGSMVPCWGMSETSSALAAGAWGEGDARTFDEVDPRTLGGRLGRLAVEHGGQTLVSVGPPLPGASVRIVDAQERVLPEGHVGRVQVRGPQVTRGYHENPEADAETRREGGFFDTGDLGYLARGRLTLTGRAKDLIIVNGLNYNNAEIEALVEEVEGVEPSFTAACAVSEPGANTERVAIFFSSRHADDERALQAQLRGIERQVTRGAGLRPDLLVPVAPERIPKTAIGKIQRAKLAQQLRAGAFAQELRRADLLTGNASTIPAWFQRRPWRRCDALPAPLPPGAWVVLGDPGPLAQALVDEGRRRGRPVRLATQASAALLADAGAVIDLRLLADGAAPPSFDADGLAAAYATWRARLRETLGALPPGRASRLLVVTRGARSEDAAAPLHLGLAGLSAALACAALERPGLSAATVDLGHEDPAADARSLLAELAAVRDAAAVAYRAGRRLAPALAPVRLEDERPADRGGPAGLLLVTGGLGGVGFRLCEALLREPQTRLLIVGRRPPSDPVAAERLRQLVAASGVERLRYAAGDVADGAFLRAALAEAESAWGQRLAGIVHLAGALVPEGRAPEDHWSDLDAHRLERESDAVWSAVLHAKLQGTWALHRLASERDDLLFACASSVNGAFGGTGLGAYAAANAFVDAFAEWRRARGAARTYALGFSQWDDVGLSRGIPAELRAASAAGGFLPMSPGEAVGSFLAALRLAPGALLLGLDPTHPRVSRARVDAEPRQALRVAFAGLEQRPLAAATASLLGGRGRASAALVELPELPRDEQGELDRVALRRAADGARPHELRPTPPATATEQAVFALWRELLGQGRFGVDDSFFELGGHSLLATQLVSRLEQTFGVAVPLQVLFGAPSVRALAAHLERQQGVRRRPALAPLAPVERTPLSFAQQRLWFLDRLTPGSSLYNISGALRLRGALQVDALWRALEALQARHEALRTSFPDADGVPYQQVHASLAFERQVDELGPGPAAGADAIAGWARAHAALPFDLARGPLLRAALLRLAEDDHVLALSVHHIVADGWSVAVLQRELIALYEAERAGAPPLLSPLPVQYRDYTLWQRAYMPELLEGESGRYWRERLGGELPLLGLPADRPRPLEGGSAGAVHFASLPPALAARLETLAQAEGCTLFMALLAAFDVLLQQHTGQDDLLVGTPVAGRTDTALEGLIGFFVNTLVLRTHLGDRPSFRETLARVRRTCVEAYEHQDVPFEHLVEVLQPERRADRAPLVQVMFALQGAPLVLEALGGLRVEPLALHTGTAKFELTFSLERRPDELALAAEYRSDLFEPATIGALCARYQRVIEAVLEAPDAPLDALDLLPAGERAWLLSHSRGAATDYPRTRVHEAFADVARRHGQRVAVLDGAEPLTYAELELRSNRLAHALVERGVEPGDRVGLCLERGPQAIVALLAVLKAGAAYVSLERGYPRERLSFQARDAGLRLLIAGRADEPAWPALGLPALHLDEDAAWIAARPPSPPDVPGGPDDLAYVTYTSGSTGTPKGVEVRHRGVLRLVRGADYARLDDEGVHLHLAPLAFDASTFEIWGALLNGGRLALYPGRVPSAAELGRVLREARVTTLWLTASLFNALVDEDPTVLRGVRQVLTGGEALSVPHVRRALEALPATEIINGYGPTESTTFACCHRVPRDLAAHAASVPIGRPIANTSAFVLDAHGRLAPRGVTGELYLGGDGLARGYLGRPDLTAERLVAHALAGAGGRLYRTGDLVRWRADGLLDFVGRNDRQIKLRGFRIELGEIEQALGRQPGVRQAVALVREAAPGERRLAACVTGDPELDGGRLRAALADALPDYMVPSTIAVLARLPLTAHGKLDVAALPWPDPARPDAAPRDPRPARDEIDDVLAVLWREVLGPVDLHPDASFFELGGHSLKATQVLARVHRMCGVEVPVRDFFDDPTLRGLARAVRAGTPSACEPIARVAEQPDYEISNAQRRLWILDQFEEDSNAYNIYNAVRLRGDLDAAAFEAALNDVVARHESLRTVFVTSGGEPRQRVLERLRVPVRVHDLRGLADAEARARQIVLADANTEFDLARGPLLRATLARTAEHEQVLSFIVHHIVADGWSMGLLFNELATGYNAHRAGREAGLPALGLQYRDYAAWQNRRLADAESDRQRAYWLEQLAGAPRGVELPLDRARPSVQTFNGRLVARLLPRRAVEAVLGVAARSGATPFMVFLGALYVLLQRYSGQTDLTVGSPIAGRQHRDLDDQIGFFVNTLVLRARLDPSQPFAALVQQVKRVTLEAYQNQGYPFDRIVEDLGLERDLSRTPLFNVMLAFNNTDTLDAGSGLDGLEIEAYPLDDVNMAKFDLTVFLDRAGDSYLARFEYNSDLFERATAERLLDNYATLLEALDESADQALEELPLLHPRERALVLQGFNASERAFAGQAPLQVLFERQVQRTPDATAVVCDGRALSYRALNERSNRLAHVLLGEGVRTGDLVAVTLERGFDLPAAVLGVLKAGAGYVAIDPTYPQARVQHMLSDSRTAVLVTDRPRPAILSEYAGRVVDLSALEARLRAAPARDPEPTTTPGDTAYVVYTSGSTGVPNGARLAHDVLANLLAWQREQAGIDGSGRCLQFTSLNFCVSFQEIFGTLTAGGELHLIGETERQDVDYLLDFLVRQRINLLYLPFSYLNFLFQESRRFGPAFRHELRDIVTAGEQLKVTPGMQAFLKANPQVRLHNHYGSSEMHVVTAYTLSAAQGDYPLVPPAGRPIANTRAAILDARAQPVPIGVFGELYFSCAGHMPGYVHNGELTARKFVSLTLPEGASGRYYRTGDVGRWRADGNIEYKGRLDAQHKIRGFRVELGEVESALLTLPGVDECVVDARLDAAGQKYLAAYVVLDPSRTDVGSVRQALKGRLPQYMLPTLVELVHLPLMPNGKVDRERLPDPASLGVDTGNEHVPPRDDLERHLASIWAESLGLERVGVRDNFFDLGGQSLKATQVVARIERELGASVRLSSFFQHATVEELAGLVRARAADAAPAILQPLSAAGEDGPTRVPEREHYPLSHAQHRLWLFDRLNPGSGAYNAYNTVRLLGELSVPALEAALASLVERHESLRTVYLTVAGEPRQRVLAGVEVPLRTLDLGGRPEADAEARRFVAADAAAAFDLERGPLLRSSLLRLDASTHVLALVVHHIATDGWSMALLLREFVLLYNAAVLGRGAALPEAALRYRDYATWDRRRWSGPAGAAARSFWRGQLEGMTRGVDLPLDRPRPGRPRFAGRRVARTLGAAAARALHALARRADATPFMAFAAALYVFLHRVSGGQADLVVGTPCTGREREALQSLVGFCVNTFLLRARLDPGASFADLLQHVRERCLAAFAHQEYPFDLVCADLAASQEGVSGVPFNVMLAVSDADERAAAAELVGLRLERYPLDEVDLAKFDLTLFVDRVGDGHLVRFEYDSDLFEAATVERWCDEYVRLLEALPASADRPLAEWCPPVAAPERAAAAASEVAPARAAQACAALSPDEQRVGSIWRELLGVAPARPDDDFFDLGGHSLQVVPLAGRVAREFGVELPVGEFLARPTVAHLAALLRQAPALPRDATLIAPEEDARRAAAPRLYCVHGAGGSARAFRDLARALGEEVSFFGVQAPGLDAGQVQCATLRELAAGYVRALREAQPEGPYFLAGWSMGGVVAHEMACQLAAQGASVGGLALIDALAPGVWRGPLDDALLLRGFAAEQGVDLGPGPASELFEGEGGAARRRLFDVYAQHVRLLLEHVPSLHAGPLLLLHAAGSPGGDDGAMGWRRYAAGGCDVRELAGTHHGLLRAPHVGQTAQELLAWLSASRAVAP